MLTPCLTFSDGISRELAGDTWAAEHAIATKVMETWTFWWNTPLTQLWDIFQKDLDLDKSEARSVE